MNGDLSQSATYHCRKLTRDGLNGQVGCRGQLTLLRFVVPITVHVSLKFVAFLFMLSEIY